MPKRIAILGSTGSIGTQTLDVVRHLNTLGGERYEVVALAAGRRGGAVVEQARACNAKLVGTVGGEGGADGLEVFNGDDAALRVIERLIERDGVDLVVAAIVGIAGLPSVLAAADAGIDIALANKESLVAGGSLVVDACRRSGARLLPVDSEHSALWQAIQGPPRVGGQGDDPRPVPPLEGGVPRLRRMILTASGGPFRERPLGTFGEITPAEALAHPTWDMGRRVTIDCATMLNKGFELMEACWLFGVPEDRVDIVIHPGSKVHSLIEYEDRSVMAHLGPTDMRLPIQLALTWPDRPPAPVDPIDLVSLGALEFFEPEPARYPSLGLAREAMRRGGTSGAVLNAAGEEAVRRFLRDDNAGAGAMAFPMIAEVAARALDAFEASAVSSLGDVLEIDRRVRERVRGWLPR